MRWSDHREVFPSFAEAKTELLNMLWWWGRDIIDSDPGLYDLVLTAWGEAAAWQNYSMDTNRHWTMVQDEEFSMVKWGCE